MKHIKGLDTLRAFAVIIVIITHWGPHTFNASKLLTFFFARILPEGMFGVDLFFVLSGYLITNILLSARDEALPHERLHIIKNFYIRRSLRIFPIYFLLIFIVAHVDKALNNNIWYYLTYTTNFLVFKERSWQIISHTWSLAVEEQFYIIWPWVIIYSPKKYLFKIILLTLFIGILSTLILEHLYGKYFTVLLLPCVTAFSIGALYAYIQSYQYFKNIFKIVFLTLLPICIVLLFIHQMGNKFILVRLINSIIAINAIIYVSEQNYNRVTKHLFNNKLLVGLGKISYGVYLYHYIVPTYFVLFVNYLKTKLQLSSGVLKFLILPPTAYLIHFTLLVFISALSYKYIELAFLKFKKYFTYLPDKKKHPVLASITTK